MEILQGIIPTHRLDSDRGHSSFFCFFLGEPHMVVVGKHFTFLLIVV